MYITHMKKLIFVCSPFQNQQSNLDIAKRCCRVVIQSGHVPIAPHLFFPQFLDDAITGERTLGIACGIMLLSKCAELWIFGDIITDGMREEIKYAMENGIPLHPHAIPHS
jgi:hypothetical protein